MNLQVIHMHGLEGLLIVLDLLSVVGMINMRHGAPILACSTVCHIVSANILAASFAVFQDK